MRGGKERDRVGKFSKKIIEKIKDKNQGWKIIGGKDREGHKCDHMDGMDKNFYLI